MQLPILSILVFFPVLGAVLWFSAAFVLVNGLQIVTSRMGRVAAWASIRCGARAPVPIISRREAS